MCFFLSVPFRCRSRRKDDTTDRARCSLSPGKVSQKSVATLDIEVLAERNQERAHRLEAILNAGTIPTYIEEPQDILHNFLEHVSQKQLQQSLSGISVQPNALVLPQNSDTSLDCETTFHPVPSSLP